MKNIVNGKARRRIRGRLFALTLATSASMSGYAFAQAPVAPTQVEPDRPHREGDAFQIPRILEES